MKNYLYLLGSLLLIGSYQNCSDVAFDPVTAEKTRVSLSDLPPGPEVPDVVDEESGQDCIHVEEELLYACDRPKNKRGILVCHVPPGNPAAAHTICIGRAALRAHLHHGRRDARESHDRLGPCEALN